MLVSQGVRRTPTSRNIIEGITREVVFEIAQEIGIPVRESHYTMDDLFVADEAFLTANSLAILPAASVNGRRFPGGAPGPVDRPAHGGMEAPGGRGLRRAGLPAPGAGLAMPAAGRSRSEGRDHRPRRAGGRGAMVKAGPAAPTRRGSPRTRPTPG